jgi:hypothetical protein
MSDNDLEQWINIKFCLKNGRSVSETLALLALAYVGYTVKKSSVLEWRGRFWRGREHVQDVGSQKLVGQMQMWTRDDAWCAQIED